MRFPQQDIVLFNRAASEMCGVPIDQALDMRMDQIFTDPKVHETARRSSQQPVGLWPGHSQDHLQTRLSGRQGSDGRVEPWQHEGARTHHAAGAAYCLKWGCADLNRGL